MSDDNITIDVVLGTLTEEQTQRLVTLTIVAGVLRKEETVATGKALTTPGKKTKLDVLDLYALTQYVIDGQDPWKPPQERVVEVTPAQQQWPDGTVTASVTRDDEGVRVKLHSVGEVHHEDGTITDPEGLKVGPFGEDPDRTTDLAGELLLTDDEPAQTDVYSDHPHPNESGMWIFREDLGRCVPVEEHGELSGATLHDDGDGPE